MAKTVGAISYDQSFFHRTHKHDVFADTIIRNDDCLIYEGSFIINRKMPVKSAFFMLSTNFLHVFIP